MILINLAFFIDSADGARGGVRGWEPQVDRSVLFEELFVRLPSKSSPSAPLSSADDGIRDRLIVVLFSVRFEVMLAMDLNRDMPSVPPSGTNVLLWAKIPDTININKSNINLLIPTPTDSFEPLFKNAVFR
jgi:hypothetical protein